MYYKNKENKPYFQPSQKVIEKDELVEITEDEFNQIVYEINNPPIIEEHRIFQIKAKASELILAKYSIVWQLNHPRTDVNYASDYAYIDRIRDISNEAEANGTALEDIDWNV